MLDRFKRNEIIIVNKDEYYDLDHGKNMNNIVILKHKYADKLSEIIWHIQKKLKKKWYDYLCLIEMAVLVFCIDTHVNGWYSAIKQNTIYDILMIFDMNSNVNTKNDKRYHELF